MYMELFSYIILTLHSITFLHFKKIRLKNVPRFIQYWLNGFSITWLFYFDEDRHTDGKHGS